MLRRSRNLLRFQSVPKKNGAGLFDYNRALDLTPGQMFSRNAIIPSSSASNHQRSQNNNSNNDDENDLDNDEQDHSMSYDNQAPRRWIRGGDELCVAQLQKSASLLTSYEATYRFNDPHWSPMLNLPCGQSVALEIRARHINYGLRHLVQKGHAFYVVRHTDHSVFYPKGLAAVSHVTCSLDEKNERLLTSIVHEGPVDADDPDGRWDIVAASEARSMAQAFQRRDMLWKRSRRIGSLQSQMGTYNWELYSPREVGRREQSEVLLLKNETVPYGNGLVCRGIVSSHQIAKHPYHYVNQFEAPAQFAGDIFSQAMNLNARQNGLLRDGEKLHLIAWKTRSFKPYSPIELDLPFEVHCTPPQVYRGDDMCLIPSPRIGHPYIKEKEISSTTDQQENNDVENNNKKHNNKKKRLAIIQMDCALTQGASQYLYDDSAAARSPNWWAQKNALPYECTFYCVREGLLDLVDLHDFAPPFERMRNRFHSADAKKAGLRHLTALEEEQYDVDLTAIDESELSPFMTDDVKENPIKKRNREIAAEGKKAGPALTQFENHYNIEGQHERAQKLTETLSKMARASFKSRKEAEKKNPALKGSSLSVFQTPSSKVLSRRQRSQKVLDRISKRQREEEEKKMPKKKLGE